MANEFFTMVEGDTGLLFQKTIIYQVSADAESPETHIFWFRPWEDPVRRKRNAGLQPDVSWSNFTPPFVPPAGAAVLVETVSGGVIFPRSFIYQALARNPFTPPPEVITEDKWHFPWSEPVRQKKGLRSDLQQAWVGVNPFPIFIRTIGWYDALSEPVRLKKGLKAYLQQFFVRDQNKPQNNPVNLTMSAFEINLDTAIFGVFVGEEPFPPTAVASANVTIVEIPAISGAKASIREDLT